jgi:hypothetical protein
VSGWRVFSGILLGCLILSLFKIVALVFLIWVAISMVVGVVCLVSANIQDRRALARKRFDADVKELGREILDNMDPDVRAARESARRDVADPAWWFDQGFLFTGAALNEGLSASSMGTNDVHHLADVTREPVIKQPPRRAQASGHDADVGPRIGAAPRVPPIIIDKDGRQHCAEHSIVSGGIKSAPQRIDVPTISCPTCTVLAGH